ncbi:MAG: Stk1 family PASTA domain-containing Ser/Thr kinase [Coriobacteriales bacterium]|nr:Stk1 family PASTA domain-containing Ser/Thr kinase [Coriobacteriales bacterium]
MPSRRLGGRYTIQDKIGTGGMAVVYRGLDEVLGRTVAVKIMLPQYATDESFAARFKQEAQAAAALQSPYIVSVYDWGKDGDTYYIVMEYLRGTDLKSGIRKHGALDCRKVAQIGSQISQALTIAHRHDIIHRDIKPQNIMVQPDGNIKVMDFGIARAKNSHLTADNSVLGTAHYVSPEQTQGRQLGPTTDIYSLGIVMYEAATGRVPFNGDDAISVAYKQVNEPPMPPSQINPLVDPALESIILKCMQKNPADRFQTANELYHVLRDYLAGRMQAVNEATAVVATPGSGRMRQLPDDYAAMRQRQQKPARTRSRTGASGSYRVKSATQEELDRRHRRNTILGVILALVALLCIGGLAFAFLGRPQTRTVPNLVGLTQDAAVAQIKQTDYFEVGTVKEEYDSKMEEGKVIDQDPDEGRSAKEGTAINLWISKGPEPAKSVTVPDLTNMTPTEADEVLMRVGLVGKPGDSVFSDTVESGKIAAQTPAGNTTAKAGDTITYQLSKGAETVEVPYVVGWGEAEARSTLQEAGFSVVVNSEENDSVSVGIVFYQSVTGTANKGSEIVLTVSSGTSKASVPYVVGQTEGEATAALSNAGFVVSSTTTPSDAIAEGYVVSQSVSGTATRGTTVSIQVSSGPETQPDPEPEPEPDPDSDSGNESGSESDDDSKSENKDEGTGDSGSDSGQAASDSGASTSDGGSNSN